MKISIIADDLTGASDSGVQLSGYGLKTSVVFNQDAKALHDKDVVIFDTDSRSLTGQQAYEKVKRVSEFIKKETCDVIYKKIDSTMRGNIGQEINAIYDVFQPDFVIIAPGYPENGRQVIHGFHYLNQRKLHETEVANDPKTPVKTSYLPQLIQEQSRREVAHISVEDLLRGCEHIAKQLKEMKKKGIRYIVFDSVNDEHLNRIMAFIRQTKYAVVWAGSAGFSKYLPINYGWKKQNANQVFPKNSDQILFVSGSMSGIGRKQLNQVLLHPKAVGIEMTSKHVVQEQRLKNEELQFLKERAQLLLKQGYHIALYSSQDVKETQEIGGYYGHTPKEASDLVSQALGELAADIINENHLKKVFLTGGDTAGQVFKQLQATEFHLIDEVEPGIPLGRLYSGRELDVVTKAGNFGSEFAILKAMMKLQGDDDDETYDRHNNGRRCRSRT
ncbi:uncharacterized protein YgbK (DUF1537 family) [Scopulibacillus darangshiensis]|uniref:Uncharacterized protein YgbK (DUF1537 family) n=1 Tax=Scopulibacillus darangshiensis TaxID=442528 RepID=A0A4R2NPL0_9BACL|nr:four-carbon acid sugar kinase family protein [Scopulibacillus darangshiensis]TCP23759.1 uncharacterized protein YgbK (DUF1537 family) [Scopulibacillus darangshiensis]